jgi:hypothetical protein
MNKEILSITLSLLVCLGLKAQTNTFPSTGKVGVGTTTPTADLHIANGSTSPWLAIDKPINYESGIQFRRTGTTQFYFYSDNDDNDALKIQSTALTGESDATPRIQIPYTNKNLYFVQSGGSVAMGHANPYSASRLHVKSPGPSQWGFVTEAFANQKLIGVGHDGNAGYISVSYLGTAGYSPLYFRTGELTRMTVDENGKVGVGTSTPQLNFEVVGNGQIIRNSNGGDYSTLRLYNNQNNGMRSLEMDYSGSGYTGPLVNGGPTGESGSLTTTGAFPLVLGTSNTARIVISSSGDVGIGTKSPDQKLTVKGKIHSEEVIVDLSVPAPDYVFEQNYSLTPLDEVQAFIAQHKHLPEVPSAKEMEKDGVKVGEMEMLLLKKMEEMTLHMIKMNERLIALEQENKQLKNR